MKYLRFDNNRQSLIFIARTWNLAGLACHSSTFQVPVVVFRVSFPCFSSNWAVSVVSFSCWHSLFARYNSTPSMVVFEFPTGDVLVIRWPGAQWRPNWTVLMFFFKCVLWYLGFCEVGRLFNAFPAPLRLVLFFFSRDLGTIGTLGTTGAFQTGSTVNRSIVISQLSTSIYLLSIRSIRILGLCRFLFFDSFWLCQDMVSFSERHGVCIKGFKASSEKLLILAGSWWDNHRSNAFTSGTERCVFASFIPVELKLQWMWKNIDTCTYHITVHT